MKLAEAFKIDIDQMVFDNFADAGCAIDVRHRYAEALLPPGSISFAVASAALDLSQRCDFRPFTRKKYRYLLADPARGAKQTRPLALLQSKY